MKRLIVSISFIILGCGVKNPMPFAESHTDFSPYVGYFEQYTGIITYTPINYYEVPKGKLAVCYVSGSFKWIAVNKNWFLNASETDRLILVLHEYGHCELNKHHNNLMLDFECPYSIMNENHIGEYCFKKYENHYLQEYLK